MPLRRLLGNIRGGILSAVQRREFRLPQRGPLISFSFDDFPSSAVQVGGEILKSYGARGTYYAAMGLMGKTSPVMGPYFNAAELQTLLTDGQELGSHTFGHVSGRSTSLQAFEAEVMKGRQAVAGVTGGGSGQSFSYPYGHVTWRAKGRIGSRLASCRGIYPGINFSPVDLNLLRANNLYDGTFNLRAISELVAANAERNGWLIFYMHDISEHPSDFGCTPEQFECVVKLAAKAATVLPVGQVTGNLSTSPPSL